MFPQVNKESTEKLTNYKTMSSAQFMIKCYPVNSAQNGFFVATVDASVSHSTTPCLAAYTILHCNIHSSVWNADTQGILHWKQIGAEENHEKLDTQHQKEHELEKNLNCRRKNIDRRQDFLEVFRV